MATHQKNFIALHKVHAEVATITEEVHGGIAWSGGGTGETGTGQQSRARRATDAAMSIWKRASGRLFDLESKIVVQVGCISWMVLGYSIQGSAGVV